MFLILISTKADTINAHQPSSKVPVILVRFYWNLDIHERFSKNPQIPNLIKIRPVGAECFMRTDRETDRAEGRSMEVTKLTVAFRHFAYVPKTVPETLPCVADCERRTKRQRYFPKRVRKVNVINSHFHSFIEARKMHLVEKCRVINRVFFLSAL